MNPLIEVPELATLLASAQPPVLLDARWSLADRGGGHRAYLAGHLPGAIFVDLDHELAGSPNADGVGGRHPLPDPTELQTTLRDRGVHTDSTVVCYDAGGSPPTGAAARAWWVLRWAGLSTVRVLNGGYAAWVSDGRPVSSERVERPGGDVNVRPGGLPVLDADAAARLAHAGRLLDARVATRFRGEAEPIDRIAGHIPGAVNLPAAETVGPDGRLLDPDDLRARFTHAIPGLNDPDRVGAYCGSGVTAAHTALALTVAGYDPALYVGSWSDWIAADRPIATSANKATSVGETTSADTSTAANNVAS